MEPDLKPSYIDKADKIMRGQYVKVGSLKEMRKRYEWLIRSKLVRT